MIKIENAYRIFSDYLHTLITRYEMSDELYEEIISVSCYLSKSASSFGGPYLNNIKYPSILDRDNVLDGTTALDDNYRKDCASVMKLIRKNLDDNYKGIK